MDLNASVTMILDYHAIASAEIAGLAEQNAALGRRLREKTVEQGSRQHHDLLNQLESNAHQIRAWIKAHRLFLAVSHEEMAGREF